MHTRSSFVALAGVLLLPLAVGCAPPAEEDRFGEDDIGKADGTDDAVDRWAALVAAIPPEGLSSRGPYTFGENRVDELSFHDQDFSSNVRRFDPGHAQGFDIFYLGGFQISGRVLTLHYHREFSEEIVPHDVDYLPEAFSWTASHRWTRCADSQNHGYWELNLQPSSRDPVFKSTQRLTTFTAKAESACWPVTGGGCTEHCGTPDPTGGFGGI